MSTPLLSVTALKKGFGNRQLFDGLTLHLQDGEHVGLIGPNGAGKSTLLQIMAGVEPPDEGQRSLRRETRVSYLSQHDVFPRNATVESELLAALTGHSLEPYEVAMRLSRVLTDTGFTNPSMPVGTLSGGWKKRLAIARALVQEPDLLLLDEPTNHLDLEGIRWLEELLKQARFAFCVVTHDRAFLEAVAGRIVEIHPRYSEGSLSHDGRYSDFLEARDLALREQANLARSLAGKVRDEVAWLRRGPKARTTKARFRIDEAGRLMEELEDVRKRRQKGDVGLAFGGTGRQTRKLVDARQVSMGFGEEPLFQDVSLRLSPGMRLGILGPNGSGKTTLIRVLTGDLKPDTGSVEHAEHLKVVVFTQERPLLDPNEPLRKALADDGQKVLYRGTSVHIVPWAKRFLFKEEQLDMPVSALSGGERARVHLARLMLRPADLLVLDEPTNDLDIPTLEVLEESLLDFGGALILVTHDRFLLDKVATGIIGFDGRGHVRGFADHEEWEEALRGLRAEEEQAKAPPKPDKPAKQPLSKRERRELQRMEETIAQQDEALAALKQQLQDPAVGRDLQRVQELCDEIKATEAGIEELFQRWQELEEKAAGP